METKILHHGLVSAAADRPNTTLLQDGKTLELYPDAISKAVSLAYALIKWHAFLDGNKRTGVFCMSFILELNGIDLQLPPYMVKYSVQVATEAIDETEFRQLVTELCSSNGVIGFWKKIRYGLIPEFYYQILLELANRTRSKFISKRLYGILVDWYGAGHPEIAKQLLEEMSKLMVNPDVGLPLTKDDFLST